jgi:hypothetical protein
MADEPESDADDGGPDEDDAGCTRCDGPLLFLGKRTFHEGGSFLLPEVFEGRTAMDMWACADCGHVEFFMPLR